MPTGKATASWSGVPPSGQGHVGLESGLHHPFAPPQLAPPGEATNPEELLGAAQASCYAMTLAARLARAGYPSQRIDTQATVHLEKGRVGLEISRIDLQVTVVGCTLETSKLEQLARDTLAVCPISRALAGTTLELQLERRESAVAR